MSAKGSRLSNVPLATEGNDDRDACAAMIKYVAGYDIVLAMNEGKHEIKILLGRDVIR